MRVVFAGPSLYGADVDMSGLVCRPPAAQGDVFRAVEEGATHIGLIDGVFGQVGAVWHKEILHALERGVHVFGAASMGALRAAECAGFGMIPVGTIAQAYLDGVIDDDSAVALSMAPAEFGFRPLTEPYVDALATLMHLALQERIGPEEFWRIAAVAVDIHFASRTAEAIAERAYPDAPRAARFLADYVEHHQSQKREDALLLIETLKATETAHPRERSAWSLNPSSMWRAFTATNA